MRHIIMGLALVTAIALPAHAQQQNVVELPEGHTVLNLSATEKVEAEQDLLVASLRIQVEAKESKEVQDRINKAMKAAVDKIRQVSSIKIETGQYYVHPDYRYTNKPDGSNEQILDKWRGSQTIMLESKNPEDILKITGELQDMDFMMNSLNYRLSDEKYEELRDGLMEVTIESLNERAKRVAKALGKSTVDMVEINVDAQMPQPYPVAYARSAKMEMMAQDSAAGMAPPVAEAGESTVSMTINARAIIKP